MHEITLTIAIVYLCTVNMASYEHKQESGFILESLWHSRHQWLDMYIKPVLAPLI